MIAAKYGRDEVIRELVKLEEVNTEEDKEPSKPRININVKNKHTKAAIHYAASRGHVVIINSRDFCFIHRTCIFLIHLNRCSFVVTRNSP